MRNIRIDVLGIPILTIRTPALATGATGATGASGSPVPLSF
jgi:hypothetical protein